MVRNRPTEEHAHRIVRAMQGMTDALAERDAAVADALKAGASVREVAKVSGMSTATVQKIGRENGWPTAAQKRRWAEEQAERDRWAEVVDQYRKTGQAPRSE